MNRGIEQYHDAEFKEKPLQSESGISIRDLEGNEYPLQATITYDKELNGNQSISFRVLPSKVNTFIHDITEMWEVVADTDYKIIYCKKRGSVDKLNVEIKAIPVFFDTFDTQRIYEEYNEHMTAQLCFNRIFNGSGYNVVLNGTFEAIQWEGFGAGDTRLTLFKNALNRYKAEFTVSGNTVTIENLIGRDTQFMYRYKLNASNIVQENDATSYWTYAKGYGNYGDGQGGEDWQDAKLIREYTSPIASIIGKREAPPIKNGNITTAETMDSQLKTLVDDSLKISVSADIHDLEKYPLAQPMVGDRAFLIDERIGLETEIRIQHLSITKDWKGNILNLQAQFGSPNIVKRHQSNLQTAISNITRLLEGNIKLPFSVLDEAVAQATKALQSAQTELQFPESGGILAVDKDNPNYVVLLNSAGIGVSTDGGATFGQAMTAQGFNADYMYAGSMLADRIAGGILQSLNGRTHFNLNDGKLNIKQGAITIERPDGAVFMQDGLANLNYNVFAHNPPYTSPNVEINNYFFRTQSTSPENLNFYTYRHEGRYLKLHLAYYISNNDEGAMGNVYIVDSTNGNTLLTKTITNTGSNSDNAVFGEVLTIDLGVPNFSRNAFYLRLRTASNVVFAYARVIRIWQEG